MRTLFQQRYGASPLHLIGHVIGLGIAAFAFVQIFKGGDTVQLIEWFVGFTLLHDLVLLPLYTALDRLLHLKLPFRRSSHGHDVPLVNHLRMPALISGVLLLMYFPLISRLGARTYLFYSGHRVEGYLRNWLLISVGLFVFSGIVYLLRLWRSAGSSPSIDPSVRQESAASD